jgi:hypothetical protein
VRAIPLPAPHLDHSASLHLVIARPNPGSVNLICLTPEQPLPVLLRCQIHHQLSLPAPIATLDVNRAQISKLTGVLHARAILAIQIDPRYYVHTQARADSPAASRGLRLHPRRIKARPGVRVRGAGWHDRGPYGDTASCPARGSLR